MKKAFFRAGSAVLSIVMFTTNVALSHATEVNFWEQRRQKKSPIELVSAPGLLPQTSPLSSLAFSAIVSSRLISTFPKGSESTLLPIVKALPQNVGSVRKIVGSSHSTRTVIHIQDVHRNREAQENIGKAVQSLIENKTVDLVALEGAFEPMDFSWVRSYPHQDAVKSSADWLLKENHISGPIYTAYTLRLRSGQALPKFIGIDEKSHYDANVEAYRRAAPLVASYKQKLERMGRAIHDEKMAAFNPELKDFDAHVESYRSGAMSWGDYVRFLGKYAGRGIYFSPKVNSLLAALELEKGLNFAQVETERAQLIARLVAKLSKSETDALLSQSAAYRMGAIGHTDFYLHLKKLCADKGIDLSRTPAMDSYIRYVLLSDSLDVDAIIKETGEIEKNIAASLAMTVREKKMLAESRQLALTEKLLDFALTTEEWAEMKTIINLEDWDLSPFLSFYQEAEARDQAMAANLEKAMDASHAKVAVVVTGGFHSDGMLRQLQPTGVTVISYVPKISKIDDNGSAYLSVFTQEKTPLDQLFAGEKLFLASKPALARPALKLLVKAADMAQASREHMGKMLLGDGAVFSVMVTLGVLLARCRFCRRRKFIQFCPWRFLAGLSFLLIKTLSIITENVRYMIAVKYLTRNIRLSWTAEGQDRRTLHGLMAIFCSAFALSNLCFPWENPITGFNALIFLSVSALAVMWGIGRIRSQKSANSSKLEISADIRAELIALNQQLVNELPEMEMRRNFSHHSSEQLYAYATILPSYARSISATLNKTLSKDQIATVSRLENLAEMIKEANPGAARNFNVPFALIGAPRSAAWNAIFNIVNRSRKIAATIFAALVFVAATPKHVFLSTFYSPTQMVTANEEKISQAAAQWIIKRIDDAIKIKKQDHVNALMPTGGTPERTYALLVDAAKRGEVNFSKVKFFMLDEYWGGKDYSRFIQKHLITPLTKKNLPLPNWRVLNGKADDPNIEAAAYEKAIREAHLDFAVLGVGVEGHIGFNEKGSLFNSVTRLVYLAKSTIFENLDLMEDSAQGGRPYRKALTSGIGTILSAKEILVLAKGEKKAPIIARFWKERPSTDNPLSALRYKKNVTFIIDEAAARDLPPSIIVRSKKILKNAAAISGVTFALANLRFDWKNPAAGFNTLLLLSGIALGIVLAVLAVRQLLRKIAAPVVKSNLNDALACIADIRYRLRFAGCDHAYLGFDFPSEKFDASFPPQLSSRVKVDLDDMPTNMLRFELTMRLMPNSDSYFYSISYEKSGRNVFLLLKIRLKSDGPSRTKREIKPRLLGALIATAALSLFRGDALVQSPPAAPVDRPAVAKPADQKNAGPATRVAPIFLTTRTVQVNRLHRLVGIRFSRTVSKQQSQALLSHEILEYEVVPSRAKGFNAFYLDIHGIKDGKDTHVYDLLVAKSEEQGWVQGSNFGDRGVKVFSKDGRIYVQLPAAIVLNAMKEKGAEPEITEFGIEAGPKLFNRGFIRVDVKITGVSAADQKKEPKKGRPSGGRRSRSAMALSVGPLLGIPVFSVAAEAAKYYSVEVSKQSLEKGGECGMWGPVVIVAAVVGIFGLVVLFLVNLRSRPANEEGRNRGDIEELSRSIAREYDAIGAEKMAVISVLGSIRARQGQPSFDLAHSIRPEITGVSNNERSIFKKNFMIGLALAAKQPWRLLGNRVAIFFRTIGEALDTVFTTDKDVAILVPIDEGTDLSKIDEAIENARNKNFRRDDDHSVVVAMVLSARASAMTQNQVEARIRQYQNTTPIVMVREDRPEAVRGQLLFSELSAKISAAFSRSYPKASRMFDELARNIVDDKRVVIIGTFRTPYVMSEQLISILNSLIAIRDGYLLIDINIVRLAAKMA